MKSGLVEQSPDTGGIATSTPSWTKRVLLGTLGTAGATVALAAFATSAFANAANPLPNSTGTISSAGGTAVRVDVSGQWNWGQISGSSPQSNCTTRYGVGYAVDWWGFGTGGAAIPGLHGQVAVTTGGTPSLADQALSPTVALATKSHQVFHASSLLNGFDNNLCAQKDAQGFPTGPWQSYAIYPNEQSVPNLICVNMYDLHGSTGVPKLGDFTSSNGDNSIKTNSFDPTVNAQYCFHPTFQHPVSITVDKQNDAHVDGNFHDTETADSAGQSVTFQVKVTNTSAVSVDVDSVTDAYPVNAAASNVTCKDANNNDLVNSTIAAGATATCTFSVANYAPAAGSLVDRATVTVHEHGLPGNSTSGHDDSTVNAPDKATLAAHILLCSSGQPVAGGDLSVSGPTNVPSAAQINGASVDPGSYTVTATAPATYELVDCAGTSKSPTQTSTIAAGGSHTFNFYVAPAGSPNLVVAKTGPATGVAGGQGTYTITVTNTGTAIANGPINFVDVLPVGETFVSYSGPAGLTCTTVGHPQRLDCTYTGDLAKGNGSINVDVTVRYDVGTDGQTLTDCAGLTPATATGATQCVDTKLPKLVIDKSGPLTGVPGGSGTYTITVTNQGAGPAPAVSFTDTLPAGETFVGATGDFTCTATANPQVISCTAKNGRLPLAKDGVLSVDVLVTYGPGTGGLTLTDCAALPTGLQDCVPTKMEEPDVRILKTGPATGTAGGNGTYTITVSNVGKAPATGVTFVDVLPAGESFVSASGAGVSCSVDPNNAQRVNCSLNNPLAAGGSISVDVTVSYGANTGGRTLTDCAQLSPTNQSCVPTKIPGEPALTVTKTNDANGDGIFHDSETATNPGDPVTFKVVVTNTSTVPVAIDSVVDVYSVTSVNECASLVGTVLDPGESATCTFTITGYAPAAGSSLLDTVTVLGHEDGNPGNTTQGSDTSIVKTRTPAPGPDLAIVKSADKDTVKAGDTLTYTLSVTNVGDGPTTDTITVTDSIPSGLDLVSVDGGDSWDCTANGRDITCVYLGGDLAAGASAADDITIVTTVNDTASIRVINTGVVDTPGDVNPDNDRSTVKTPVTQVLPEKIVKTPPTAVLPFTGSNATSLLPVGLLMVLGGAALLGAARRRRISLS